jgi:TRAP-type C4-dicarboxylate transport system substrate-binding protein
MNRLLFALAALSLAAAPAGAQEVKIKLGTVAPQGSTWHLLLQEMGQKWAEASGGKVQLKVYAGGTQGNEGEMVRKMSIGYLHAAAMTTIGLKEITPEPQAEDCPGLIASYEEYEYVHARMRTELEAAIFKKGYVVLNWGEAGFVNIFSVKPRSKLSEFAGAKVFTWSGDPASEAAWKAAGFNPVVLQSTDLIPSLQTNMIDTVSQPPLYAFTAGLYDKAKYMLDLPWGLLTGATVVKRDQWEKIPAELRAQLLQIADDYGKRVVADVRGLNADALEQMKKKGLQVISPANPDEWLPVYQKIQGVVRGRVVPVATYDKVKALSEEFRARNQK